MPTARARFPSRSRAALSRAGAARLVPSSGEPTKTTRFTGGRAWKSHQAVTRPPRLWQMTSIGPAAPSSARERSSAFSHGLIDSVG